MIQTIAHPRIVIASPYARARDTGEIIAKELNLPFEIRAGLHERETGEFAGRPYEAILEADDYDPARPWIWVPPGGESYEHVRDRVGPILDEIAARFPGEDAVVVSHGGVMVAMWAHMTGRWEDAPIPANCAIILVEHRHGKYLATAFARRCACAARRWRLNLPSLVSPNGDSAIDNRAKSLRQCTAKCLA